MEVAKQENEMATNFEFDLKSLKNQIMKCGEDISILSAKMDVIVRHLSVLEHKNRGFFERVKPSFLRKKGILEEMKNTSSSHNKTFTLND